MGNEQSINDETFENGLLEYPQYTKPKIWEGKSVPEVLLSGDHGKIKDWRFSAIRGYKHATEDQIYGKNIRKINLININMKNH